MAPLGIRRVYKEVLIGGVCTFSGYYDRIFRRPSETLEYKSFYYNHQELLALLDFVYLQFTGRYGNRELIIKQDSRTPINCDT